MKTGANYTALLPNIINSASANDIYAYLVTSGFASFWPQQLGYIPDHILNNIINSPPVISPYGNVTLPNSPITCDPLLLSVFDVNSNDSRLTNYMFQVYQAHVAYYNATGQYAAFSEGDSYNGYVYEWVVAPNGSMWQITNVDKTVYYSSMDPIIYNKVAFGFLALYNSTYARNMLVLLEQKLPTPSKGYCAGYSYTDGVQANLGSDQNGLIIAAALYALQK